MKDSLRDSGSLKESFTAAPRKLDLPKYMKAPFMYLGRQGRTGTEWVGVVAKTRETWMGTRRVATAS
ncbi:hypothetical protein DMC61_27235 [Amycolatopsis sp. WAC 04169]|nr:hypothetical protein DMC61_27235 [Amycolatopsis sp. WAC 04169]